MAKTKAVRKKTKKAHTEAEYQELKKAASALASCAITTLMSDGKIGAGSGMVFNRKTREVKHWSTQFFDALDMVGIVYDRARFFAPKKRRA
jgi:hypothetical protein